MKHWFGIRSIVLLILISLFVGAENSPGSPLASMFDKHKPKPKKLFVTTLADSGPGSLREALAEANPGATIIFKVTGTIFLTSGPLLVDTSVTIDGPGSDDLLVDAQGQSQVFIVTNNVVATISDLTVTNGGNFIFAPEGNGGGIRNLGDLTLLRCVVVDCFTEFGGGGGIFSSGPLTVTQCSVSNNVATEGGGGIAFFGAELTMNSSTINSNRTGVPGGSDGGGILIGGAPTGQFAAFLTNCTISGNLTMPGDGGGIAAFSSIQLESCTVVSNAATTFGPPAIVHGGGVFVFTGSALAAHNSIFAGNVATNLTGLQPFSEGPDIFGTMISQGFNLILDPSGAVIIGDLQGNIIGEDPLLGPLQNNGGLVFTHALLPGSPAIDAGSPCNFPPTDARGVKRPQDGNGDHIFITDIGAYEKKGKGHGHGPKHEHDNDDDDDHGHDHQHDW
jgi:hypothetical protein